MSTHPRLYWNRLRYRLRGRPMMLARRVLAAGLLVTAAVLAARPAATAPAHDPPGETAARAEVPLAGGPGFSTVPIRLADAAVAELLSRGTKVDVVTLETGKESRKVLASMATVVDIRSPPTGSGGLLGTESKGPLVLISVPVEVATQVAALSLRNPVAVTLR